MREFELWECGALLSESNPSGDTVYRESQTFNYSVQEPYNSDLCSASKSAHTQLLGSFLLSGLFRTRSGLAKRSRYCGDLKSVLRPFHPKKQSIARQKYGNGVWCQSQSDVPQILLQVDISRWRWWCCDSCDIGPPRKSTVAQFLFS